MNSVSHLLLIGWAALVALLAVFGPPMWWYSHRRKAGEKRQKRWGPILLGILLIAGVGPTPPGARISWVWWFNVARAVGGAWLIAWGAKG